MKSKIFKRIAAFVLAAITAFSFIPGTTAFADGEAGNITFDYCYDSNGNMILYNGETDVDGYLAGGTGHPKPRMFVDGETAYCIQPGRHLLVNDTLYRSSSAAWDALSAGQKKAIGLALLYGYQGNWSNLSGSDDEKWVATAELVWEFVTGCRESTPPYKQVSTAIYDIQFGSNQPNTGVLADYNQIVAWMQRHSVIPSFMSGSADVASQDLEYKDGKYSLTFTDTNGVLAEFNFSSSNSKVSVSKSGNTLTLSADDPFDGKVTITASRNNIPTVSSSAKLIAYGDPNLQDVVTGVENADPVYAYLNVETPTGNIDLKKTSEDGVVAGIRFTISGEKMERTVTTAEDGTILVDGLIPGVYTVTEQCFDRYLPQDVQRVTVIGGRTTTVTFNNVLKRGDLTVTKTSEDGLVEGVKFHLYGKSLSGLAVDEYAVTDSTGKAYFKNVLIGSGYTLEEVDVSVKYVVPASQKAAIEWNKVTEKSFSNILKKWNATVTKRDSNNGTAQGDATLAGAFYGVYQGDTLIDTYTTDGKGQFVTASYVCGDDWTIQEISPSEGYLLDSTVHHVGAEAGSFTVEYNPVSLDVTEQIIKGNIAIIKHCDDGETQIETPEVGATFAIYLKAAGDYGSAKESEKDYLTCDENGFAQSKDLPYGIYTVEQVSGWDGRELMPPFDVYVANNGQTYAAQELTAADGSTIPVDGIMEIVSVDSNGYAAIKTDLPLGSYYLKELSTDEHYILPDTKYPISFDYAGQDTVLVEINVNEGKRIENRLMYGEVHGLKKDDAGAPLAGAVIGLFKPETTEFTTGTAILTATSAEDGGFSFAKVPYGNWIVHEISAPTGYVLFDKTFEANVDKDGAVIELELENTLIRGTVQLTKVDRDYPENKLTEAVFELYRDSNGNKELDKDDEKLGTLPEVSVGVYEQGDLTYGGYFTRETKAPAGFVLDENAYYFEIVEHGKTVIVENEAGKGCFINDPQTGALKIFKTSSDNRIEGFSFRVSGPNGYEKVFTTDKRGEIFIEGLRCGDYRVSEVADNASATYVLPVDKIVTISADAEVKIEMHNELRDTPKTGDDRNPVLWYSLTGVGFAGVAVCGFFACKKKRKEKK